MNWAMELREAFARLAAGETATVSFAGRPGMTGEVGREFNALAGALRQTGAQPLTRDQAHALRNRLAGILAAVHMLGDTAVLTDEEQGAVKQALQEAQKLDARLQAQ